jgi:phosphoribosylanthranilate isomerase
MKKILIQIYEIQTPEEAASMIALGVDHIGSVLLSDNEWKLSSIKDTIDTVRKYGAKSSLIPLFNDPDTLCRALDYYMPDMLHFCETLVKSTRSDTYVCNTDIVKRLIDLQFTIRETFPQIKIIRSIPIAPSELGGKVPSLELAKLFEPATDFFLTDTLLVSDKNQQPVEGFIGITGKTCDWKTASMLVESSHIPVILAGGISPENVYDALLKVRPAGVDSCTLTNDRNKNGSPVRFKKDPEKVKRLITEVQNAEKNM